MAAASHGRHPHKQMEHVQPIPVEDTTATIQVQGVSHSYGRTPALTDVSFSVPAGSIAMLLGLNGAGKTTLFSLISRLFAVQKGSIRIFGYDIGRQSREALRRIGIVFQSRTLDLDLSVRQNLAYHAALHGLDRRETNRRIEAVLETVEMASRMKDKVRSLSGGQMRRVEIARALLHEPPLLLLDEPTVGLDIQSRASIVRFIRRLVAEKGISVLWATHLIDEVELSDHAVMLRQGRVMAAGPLEAVLAQSGSSTVEEAFNRLCRAPSIGTGVPEEDMP